MTVEFLCEKRYTVDIMKDYKVWVLGEEFSVVADDRYSAGKKGVDMFLAKHPDSKYKRTLLMATVRTKRIDFNLFGELRNA